MTVTELNFSFSGFQGRRCPIDSLTGSYTVWIN